MVVPIAPIGGQGYAKTVDTFRGYEKRQIAALSYHRPRLGSPFIGLFEKKVGSKTGIDPLARRHPIIAVSSALHRQIESCRAGNHTAILIVPAILPVHITVPTTFTYLVATVPGIPRNRHIDFITSRETSETKVAQPDEKTKGKTMGVRSLPGKTTIQKRRCIPSKGHTAYIIITLRRDYERNPSNTPAATAEPITPATLGPIACINK